MDSWINSLQQLGGLLPSWTAGALGLAGLIVLAVIADVIAKRQLLRALTHLTRQTRYR